MTRYRAGVPRVAAWASRRLSTAMVVGLALVALLPEQMPPFLAAAAPPAPVEMVRTLPVPYLEAAPARSSREPQAKILQVVAQRSRARRQARREPESGALGKPGAAPDKAPAVAAGAPPAKVETDKGDKGDKGDAKKPEGTAAAASDGKPTPPADAKAAAKVEPPPEPDEWSSTEIIAALRDCLRRLAPLGAEIEVAEPVRHERCGAPAPVMLKRLGSGAGRVELQPPAMLNCAMVASLHAWVEKTLQPAAQELLASPVVRIRNVSGYSCRNRVGTTFHADRLSEHALANAVDIAGFVTADGRTVEVLGQWGPTARELREQQEKAWEAVQEAKGTAKEAEKRAAEAARAAKAARGAKQAETKAEAERTRQEAESKRQRAEEKEAEWRRILARAAELQKLGRGVDGGQPPRAQRSDQKKADEARGLPSAVQKRTADAKGPIPIPVSKDGESPGPAPEVIFLRRLHRGACATFGTVLGPEANEAHRNHFHFDLAARKHSAFCE